MKKGAWWCGQEGKWADSSWRSSDTILRYLKKNAGVKQMGRCWEAGGVFQDSENKPCTKKVETCSAEVHKASRAISPFSRLIVAVKKGIHIHAARHEPSALLPTWQGKLAAAPRSTGRNGAKNHKRCAIDELLQLGSQRRTAGLEHNKNPSR